MASPVAAADENHNGSSDKLERPRGLTNVSDGLEALDLATDAEVSPTSIVVGLAGADDDDCDASSERSPASTSGEPTAMVHTKTVVLADELDAPAKYSFCELLAAVLSMDFLKWQSYNRDFCTWALNTFAKHVKLPDKAVHALQRQMHACGDGRSATDEDDWPRLVTDVLVEVRRAAPIRKYGANVLVADMLAVYVAQGVYDSRSRSLVRHMGALLGVAPETVDQIEDGVAHLLVEETYVETEEAVAERRRKAKRSKYKRWALVGATGAVGGLLIGLTGGLAAPMVAAGAGVVVGAGAAAGIATTAGAAVVGTLFGLGGAGLSGYKMSRRVGALQEFIVEPLTDGQALHASIAVSGWVTRDDSEAFRDPWRHLRASSEQYTVRWESNHLLELGQAMDYFMSTAVSFAIHQTLMETALAGLVTAVAMPAALLGVASTLDNPWSVCVHRSALCGRHLAELLLRRQHGRRPVTLVGFGLGARVIYHCLMEMVNSADSQPHGIVDNVYLLGAPVAGSAQEWHKISSIVGGRLINGYCRTDWLLKFLYRTMNAQFSIAGTSPVTFPRALQSANQKVLNVNLSHIVNGHMDYLRKLRECLDACGARVAPRRDESSRLLAVADAERQQLPPPAAGESTNQLATLTSAVDATAADRRT